MTSLIDNSSPDLIAVLFGDKDNSMSDDAENAVAPAKQVPIISVAQIIIVFGDIIAFYFDVVEQLVVFGSLLISTMLHCG